MEMEMQTEWGFWGLDKQAMHSSLICLPHAGDEIPKEDTAALLKELCDPEDEDGFFPYKPFVDR